MASTCYYEKFDEISVEIPANDVIGIIEGYFNEFIARERCRRVATQQWTSEFHKIFTSVPGNAPFLAVANIGLTRFIADKDLPQRVIRSTRSVTSKDRTWDFPVDSRGSSLNRRTRVIGDVLLIVRFHGRTVREIFHRLRCLNLVFLCIF